MGELSIWDGTVFLNFSVGKGVILVEEAQNDCLVAVSHEDILLGAECWLEVDSSMLEEPGQVTVTVLMLVEGLELTSTGL